MIKERVSIDMVGLYDCDLLVSFFWTTVGNLLCDFVVTGLMFIIFYGVLCDV